MGGSESDESASPEKRDLLRMQRVADQMISCHSVLRDRYARRSMFFDVVILILTALVTIFSFAQEDRIDTMGMVGMSLSTVVGITGCGAFLLTLVQLQCNWRGRAAEHERATRVFAKVKADISAFAGTTQIENADFVRLREQYALAGDQTVQISEHEFLQLKRRHLLKVSISKMLDTYPGLPVWLAQGVLTIKHSWQWTRRS
jgi:hypothetical protein